MFVTTRPEGIITTKNLISCECSSKVLQVPMMTSSNVNVYRVTGPLCGDFTGLRWIPRTKDRRGALMISLICWITDWLNYREAGDSRRYCAHYDVIVMMLCTLLKRFGHRQNVNGVKHGIDMWGSFLWSSHDDIIKWKYFTPYLPFVGGIHRSQRPVTRCSGVIYMSSLIAYWCLCSCVFKPVLMKPMQFQRTQWIHWGIQNICIPL